MNNNVCDLTPPPSIYIIRDVKTKKDLLKNYKDATMKISHWQNWYNIQVGSNYFSYSNSN
ncbi:hypothetical protein [uncultured Brachyspira sp.]|uniref:hypothetical protein n=1 Tax=uncultured Brachyspira sp. TaxID=221953 RepID=UPI0026148172|nr:hypothetical protein [uncultured Brachyspira sp.]